MCAYVRYYRLYLECLWGFGNCKYSNITLSENVSFYLIQTKRIIIIIIMHMQACVEIVTSETEYWRPALDCSTLVVGLLGDIQARQLVMLYSLLVVSRHELVVLRPVMCPSPIHRMILVYEWIVTWSIGGKTANFACTGWGKNPGLCVEQPLPCCFS